MFSAINKERSFQKRPAFSNIHRKDGLESTLTVYLQLHLRRWREDQSSDV